MVGCGNVTREPISVVLGRVKKRLAERKGSICVCMEKNGRVVLNVPKNALVSTLLLTVDCESSDALERAGEEIGREMAARMT